MTTNKNLNYYLTLYQINSGLTMRCVRMMFAKSLEVSYWMTFKYTSGDSVMDVVKVKKAAKFLAEKIEDERIEENLIRQFHPALAG